MTLELIRGDITRVDADAIVNAANSALLGGGGVDGAIHRAAGPELLAECRLLHGCPTGQAKLTKGYRLPARHVIHTVGPVWGGGARGEEATLARCYKSVFALVEQHGLRSVAFPSISTGVYRFPIERASLIALREIRAALGRLPQLEKVTVVLFSQADLETYQRALTALSSEGGGGENV
ncbi:MULTISPECIES: O-acetyl-ADP-ribose deacetylase [unclassified Myxococcus]|jgi:O-acetyl-ADP-ribose deacetylase (regulator of RNase III)|uniref:O-acetyl-ADP-ribose deacetylase n=1 Tax=unclassified Myxococcus TaxID=2648731 RepID=UPI001CBF7D05|nr:MULTISPECIES: O-acetyl-ADP-ribose deacetylase [unclassified Myxococcus]MBZ4399051.1 O-acetyl-ADP-ribose deacetylase [Myxococcus sp. AS-1-15]MBZ4413352.1 O-acetyl-ADP-ribose deacetylase [Myxococcus sp. XM-1-1-1]BDT38702.1 O-acetyl-ADP-ribose deacetylase [Myxococcus sp. MH1]